MIWNHVYDANLGSVVAQWNTYYSGTTLLKNRFTISGSSDVTLSSGLHTLYWKYGVSSGAGLIDSVPNKEFVNRSEDVYAAEMLGKDTEIYAFRDTSGHYIVNVYGVNDDNVTCWLHSGVASDSTDVCYTNDSVITAGGSVLGYTTAYNTINNGYGLDYTIQPLCALGKKTPFFIIGGNTELAVFTVLAVNNRKFMVVGKGVCVEMNV